MIDYNLVYVAVWALAFISIMVKPSQSKCIFYCQVAVVALFVALRFETGYDWPVYEAHYVSATMGEQFNLEFEIGYEFLVHVFSHMGVEFQQFAGIVSIVEILLIASAVRFFFPRYSIWLMAILFAIPDFYLIPSFSLIRQALAASLFLYGLRHYAGNNRVAAWSLFGLAVSMHYSVIGALFFLFIAMRVKISKNVFAILFVMALSLYLLSIDIARTFAEFIVLYSNPKYMIYLDRDVYNASIVYRLVYGAVSTLIFGLIYIAWNRRLVDVSHFPQWNSTVYRLAMLGVLIPLVVYGFPTFSTRYQYFFCLFMLGVSLSMLTLFKASGRLVVLVVTCLISYIPFYRFLTNPLSIVYIPYQSQIFYDKKSSTGQQRTDDLLNQLDILWSK